jgi:hypothetical protein
MILVQVPLHSGHHEVLIRMMIAAFQIQLQNQNLQICAMIYSQLAVRDSHGSLKNHVNIRGRKMGHNFLSPTLWSPTSLVQLIRKF